MTFRLLNHPGHDAGEQIFSVATRPEAPSLENDVSIAQTTLQQVKPKRNTPLSEHIQAIIQTIEAMNDTLRASGKKVGIVIATDGIPTIADGEPTKQAKDLLVQKVNALKRLEIILVVRLCTNKKL